MSYCRFENTVRDMRDCINALDESGWDIEMMLDEAPSEQEAEAMKQFVEICRKVAEFAN